MVKKITIYILALLAVWTSALAQETEFKATAPSTVVQGNRFQLVYTINKEANDIRVPDITDFQILMGPTISQSSSVQIVNNQVSRSTQYSYTYVLRADNTGRFTIPAASIQVNGQRVQSNPVTIEVIESEADAPATQPGQQPQPSGGTLTDEDIYITMTANKSEVWQDEPLVVTTRIYTRVNLEGISDVRQPELRNFLVEELESESGSIQWSMENIRGRNYRVGTFNQRVLYPQTTGRITIEPTSIEFLVRQRQARQSHSIFGDFFDSYRTVRKRVSTDPINIQVKPLPSPRPANFSGVVGNISLNVTASSTDVKVNDGITVRAEISGTGNHRLARNPQFNFPPDFDIFDPNISNNIRQTAQGGRGTRTIETLIIPRHAGTFEIPQVEYSFFNPSTGRYQTLRSEPITINVERTAGVSDATTPVAASPGRAATRENVRVLGQDIRFIRTSPMVLQPGNVFLFGSRLFVLAYVVPIILFFIIFFLNKKRIKENADVQKVRNRRANRIARKNLKKSAQLLKKGDQEGFYEELARALWGYTSDKLSIPRAELNKDNARNILINSGAEEQISDEFLGIIDTCEYARYSPQNDHSERDELYKKTLTTISKLEQQLKKGL
ncbi:BatD protein [Alkalitalea saponilacus]|nr:BatD protein [Alkalitalea saponilacus]